jgi:hypothetical protein
MGRDGYGGRDRPADAQDDAGRPLCAGRLTCWHCGHQADADLPALIAAGHGDVPLVRLRWRCSRCRSSKIDMVVTSRDRVARRRRRAGRCGRSHSPGRRPRWRQWMGMDESFGTRVVLHESGARRRAQSVRSAWVGCVGTDGVSVPIPRVHEACAEDPDQAE